ncbi:MAG TPA: VWA domain-containing protein [Bryobacteraceae bacterium]|nr:VWA domain-containing protein [Bryobacteraceae bacterium]
MRIIVLIAIAAFSSDAQPLLPGPVPAPESRAILRVDANLVLVPVTVTNNRGAVIANLDRNDFVLTEQDRRQEIISFSHETAPISLGLVVDLSGSMASKIAKVHVAVGALLDNLEPEDEEFLVTFADTPELRLPFSSDPSSVRSALSFAQPRGSTALFDAVDLAAKQMHSARNRRRVIFVISDGGDNHSRLTERELRRMLDEEDVQIHAIGIHDHMASREESRGPWILEDLARMTGGQHHMVENIDELPSMAAKMGLALHDRYLLGYKPTPLGESGMFRKIEVKVVQPAAKAKVYVYARRGYRVP